jgi:molybdopterin-guanine dinucleotide biosynthesis protein A
MGPLGGIAAALHLAEDEGYAEVLTCGVDAPDLPENLPDLLAPAPSYLAAQPVIGLWPSASARRIEAILEGNGRHSMLAFAEALGARAVALPSVPANINTPADLAAAEKRHGL